MHTAEDGTHAPGQGAKQLNCTLEALVERARSLAAGGTRRILGITGAPGAGKSTAAEAIARALEGKAALVGMDAFHLANKVLDSQASRDRKGAPETFDPWGYANLLRRLKSDPAPVIYAPAFDRGLEESLGGAVPVGRDVPLVITEGNYLLVDTEEWRAGRHLMDQVWYLETEDDERKTRLVRRHQAFGKPRSEAEAWALGSDQRNADIVEATRERADLIIRLTGSYGPAKNA